MADKIKLRRDTQANWEAVNPILDEGELGVILDTNALVIGDGVTPFNELQEIPNQELPNEYFNIYKNSKLLFESTTDFYGLPQYLVTDPATMKQYIVVRKSTEHAIGAPSQIVKINLETNEEIVLIDGINSTDQRDYRDGFLVYHNNIPYIFVNKYYSYNYSLGINILNALTGELINNYTDLPIQMHSCITINNEIYFIATERSNNTIHYIMKYSFDTNTFTVLNTFSTSTNESEFMLGKINGKFFSISRTYDIPNVSFSVRIFNSDWSIKKETPLDLGHPVYLTTPYIFRKGSKLLFTFISRNGSIETPGNLFTYEITEENDNFNLELKNIFSPLLPEDIYHISTSDYISITGYQFPVILPFSKTGLILVEDNRASLKTYYTRLYQLDYDNDISVDYSN